MTAASSGLGPTIPGRSAAGHKFHTVEMRGAASANTVTPTARHDMVSGRKADPFREMELALARCKKLERRACHLRYPVFHGVALVRA